jgi:hypothetical protein
MHETWRGGTDMLQRCCEYILENPANADVPAGEGVSWAEAKDFGRVEGTVNAVGPVALSPGGRLALFVAADTGDHLFTCDGKNSSVDGS